MVGWDIPFIIACARVVSNAQACSETVYKLATLYKQIKLKRHFIQRILAQVP